MEQPLPASLNSLLCSVGLFLTTIWANSIYISTNRLINKYIYHQYSLYTEIAERLLYVNQSFGLCQSNDWAKVSRTFDLMKLNEQLFWIERSVFLKKIHFYIGTGERFYFFGYKVGISLTEVQCKIIQCTVSSIITYKGKLVETTQIDNQSIVILKLL